MLDLRLFQELVLDLDNNPFIYVVEKCKSIIILFGKHTFLYLHIVES